MDDARLEQACVEIVAAGAQVSGGGASPAVRDRVASAAAVVMPSLLRQVRAIGVRNAKLLREARLEPEDVAQEVLRRLIESPPCNPEGRDPVAAVLGWARAVANNILLDRRRRTGRERPPAQREDEDAERRGTQSTTEPIDPERPAEDVLEVLAEIERMHAASEHLASYKYLRETFRVLVKEPEVSALELAQRVGLIEAASGEPPAAEYRARARKAAQYAWKLRQRMLDMLADRLGTGRRGLAERAS